MQGILSALGRAFCQSLLIVGLIGLISLSGLWFQESSLAAVPTERQPTLEKGIDKTDNATPAVDNREESYEKALKAVDNPKGIEKVYEKNLSTYEDTQPNKGIVEEAKELVEKVTEAIP